MTAEPSALTPEAPLDNEPSGRGRAPNAMRLAAKTGEAADVYSSTARRAERFVRMILPRQNSSGAADTGGLVRRSRHNYQCDGAGQSVPQKTKKFSLGTR